MKKLFVSCLLTVLSIALMKTALCQSNEKYNSGNHQVEMMRDIDGNEYKTVRIGEQLWMAENLRTTRYADGTMIPMKSMISYNEPCRYAPGKNKNTKENISNVPRFGYLYNWAAVMNGASESSSNPSGVQGVCPDGWHVPGEAEWTQLVEYLSSQNQYVHRDNEDSIAKAPVPESCMKSESDTSVVQNTPSVDNTTVFSDFSDFPAGCYYDKYGYFGRYAIFWSSTVYSGSHAFSQDFYGSHTLKNGYLKAYGFSVRCLRD